MEQYRFNLVAGDWAYLERVLNLISSRLTIQAVRPTSIPTFAGLHLTDFSGILFATDGVVDDFALTSDGFLSVESGVLVITKLIDGGNSSSIFE